MTPEAKNPETDVDDLNTTAPNLEPEAWKMPEPVFRKTSGRLLESFEKRISDPEETEVDVVQDQAPISPAVDSYVQPKPKSPVLKIVVVVLAVGAMIAFLVVFLTIVYFFFLRPSE